MARQSNLLDAILAHLGPFALLASTIEHLPKKYLLVQSAKQPPKQPRWQAKQNQARKWLKTKQYNRRLHCDHREMCSPGRAALVPGLLRCWRLGDHMFTPQFSLHACHVSITNVTGVVTFGGLRWNTANATFKIDS